MMIVTRKELEAYKVNERLVERNMKKIEDEKFKDIPTVYGKVRSSMNEHPYIETHMAVQMEEPVESDKRIHKLQKWEQEVSKARSDNAKIEEFIESIKDVKIREIFIYRFIDNKGNCRHSRMHKWKSVAINNNLFAELNKLNKLNSLNYYVWYN